MGGADNFARIASGQDIPCGDRCDRKQRIIGLANGWSEDRRGSFVGKKRPANSRGREKLLDRDCAARGQEPANSANAGNAWSGSIAPDSRGDWAVEIGRA